MKPLIRVCEQKDIQIVCDMETQWAKDEITYGFGPSSADELVDSIGEYFLVAELEQEVIGYIRGEVSTSKDICIMPDGTTFLEILDLYVQEPFRSQGIGACLIERIQSIGRENGIDRFRVHSATKDIHRVLKFYQSQGFKSWYVEMFI